MKEIMTMSKEENPFTRWRAAHPHGATTSATNIRIAQWLRVNDELLELFDMYDDDIKPWLTGVTSRQPDLVAFVAGYGYTRIVTGNWTDLPIEIPEAELSDWQENSGLVTSLDELRNYQAGVAACIPEMLHVNMDLVQVTLKNQLSLACDELSELAAKPVDAYTPTEWPEESYGDEYIEQEDQKLRRLFDVYEMLYCFESGIEELRIFMITEDNPELHVPNQAFYDTLVSIDSRQPLEIMQNAEPKLREIIRAWARVKRDIDQGRPFYREDPDAPDAFWWRHFKVREKQTSRSNRHRNPRPGR